MKLVKDWYLSFVRFFLHFSHIDWVYLANATQRLLTSCHAIATSHIIFLRASLLLGLFSIALTEYVASNALKICRLSGDSPTALFHRCSPRLRRKQLIQFQRCIVADSFGVGSTTAPVSQLIVWVVMTAVVMVDSGGILQDSVVTLSMIARASWLKYFLKYISGAFGFFFRFTLFIISLLTIRTHGYLMAIYTHVTISNWSWWIFFYWNLVLIDWCRFFGVWFA